MYEGKIIKHYRRKANLTQEQLGEGICSVTHISKIERGITEYSSEISTLLAERLGIDMEQEVSHLLNLKNRLDHWHELMISQNMRAAAMLYDDLRKDELLELSEHASYCKLLIAKYHLTQGDLKSSKLYIDEIQVYLDELSAYEMNVFRHVLALYHSARGEYRKAIDIFNTIDLKLYPHPAIHYDLAVAYLNVQSPVLAYHYAEKALNHFKKTNQFLRIIDTENLMLIQVESDRYRNFNDTIEQYENLLKLCDLCNSLEKKAKILHNFAYEHYRRKNYEAAGELYMKSMALKEKDTPLYLLSLEGYTRSALFGKYLPLTKLIELIEGGLRAAEQCSETLYILIFTLHKFSALQQEEKYHAFLQDEVLPYLKLHGYTQSAQAYDRELFNYYTGQGKPDKALKVAKRYINMDYVTEVQAAEVV